VQYLAGRGLAEVKEEGREAAAAAVEAVTLRENPRQ
jgi:hypothetical protein